jgi:acetyl esterase/lipase
MTRSARAHSVVLAACVALVACSAPVVHEDVPYDSRFEATKLDVFGPDDDGRARPAVMLIHGGAWVTGSKRQMRSAAERLARSGYVAAAINYRLLPDGAFPHMFQDVGCALAFLQTQSKRFGIDPERIAVLGYSAGGHLAALLGVAWDEPAFAPTCSAGGPSAPAAVIPGAGVYDFRGNDSALAEELLGGEPNEVPENYERASPLAMVDRKGPPFLLIGGAADWLVDEDQALEMRDALRAAGGTADLLLLAGTGHVIGPSVDPGELSAGVSIETPEAWLAIADFLARTVGEP